MSIDQLYTKHFNDINVLAEKLNYTLDNLPSCATGESMEETEIRLALHRAAERLDDAKRSIEYYSNPTKEERLRKNRNGKFEIDYIGGGSSYPLSYGSDLEIYLKEDVCADIEEGWYSGRVEYTSRDGKKVTTSMVQISLFS